jgi:hypothetical protein
VGRTEAEVEGHSRGRRVAAPFSRLRLVGYAGGAISDELAEDHIRKLCG